MKKIFITLLSITLSYSSFAALGPDAEVLSYELDERIQLDDKLSEELKTIQGPVFLYSEQTDEFFKFDKNTGTAFKSSEENYQTAALPAVYIFLWGFSAGMVAAPIFTRLGKKYGYQ